LAVCAGLAHSLYVPIHARPPVEWVQNVVHFSVALVMDVQVCLIYRVILGGDRDNESWRATFIGGNGQQPIRIVIMCFDDVVEYCRGNVLKCLDFPTAFQSMI
jgi:hypothetical protein